MTGVDFIFAIAILIMSVVIHEVSHGYAAYLLGDSTAKYAGRLTLNPLNHLDFVGSFLVPMFTYLMGGFILGWAKPVPYNPYNLKNQKWGPAIVGIAGPASNFFVALVFGMFLRFSGYLLFLPNSFFDIASLVVFINLILAIFNLVPIPPLDGSKILFAVLPYSWREVQNFLERYGFFLLLFFIFFFWRLLLPIMLFLFRIITNINF
ncbi:site-2 protease family protein [Patescibacteria group bacterium]|nr:site-2 protease family protein [Patescibacteria group bacterium]